MIDSILTMFIIIIENTKQLKNEMEQKKGCNICHVNAQNTAYLISYLVVFCFEGLKDVQNFCLKHGKTQKLSYI